MRIGIIGCGSIGRRHLKNLLALGERDLIAHDPDAAIRCDVERTLGVTSAAHLDDLWARQPDAVVINTPTDLHVPIAMEAARRGCHFLLEKPLSHTLDGIDDLIEVTERNTLTTMVGCNMRFHPGPAAVKRALDRGVVGDVLAIRVQFGSFLPRWRPWQDYTRSYSASPVHGGVILDGIHEIDLALWYGGPATLIAATSVAARSIGLDTDGVSEMMLRYASGAIGSIHLNFVQRDYDRRCDVIGSEGSVHWNFADGEVRVAGADGETTETHRQPDGWELNQMYVDEMTHFLGAVAERRDTVNSVRASTAALQLAIAARQWPEAV